MPAANGNGNAADVLEKSVTRSDYNEGAPFAGVYRFIIPALGSASGDLSAFWSPGRDYVLSSTLYREAMWSAAVSIAISKIVAQGYEVESDIPLRAKRGQDLMIHMDGGRGYVSGLQKHLLNYLLTGNGAHVEIVRATRAAGSRVLGLVPLDTFRCIRTGDPDFPIIYRSRDGREHVMRWFDVFSISDLPDPQDTWYGVGHCAAERAYKKICTLEGIERFIFEKVTGQRPLSLFFVNGVTPEQLSNAIKVAQADAQAKGMVNYMGAAIVSMLGDVPVQSVEIPLASLPSGFERKEEWDIALTVYARSLGIAVQDLQPLSGQGLGTGTQSVVLDESAKGQGLAAWRQAWEYNVNEFALDDRTTYYIRTNDIRDREREAVVEKTTAETMQVWIGNGLSAAQAINLGVDKNVLPPEYRVEGEDLTPGAQYNEDEKPAQETAMEDNAPEGGEQQPNTDVVEAVEKAARDMRATLDRQERREKERQLGVDADERALLSELVTALKEAPAEAQPVVIPAPVVNVPAPIVRVTAPAPVVLADTKAHEALARVEQSVKALSENAGKPRRVKVLKRDSQGRMTEWEEA